jgi:DNA mismatch repair protein MutS2
VLPPKRNTTNQRILPTITEERRLIFEMPSILLFLNNKKKNEITHPQTIELNQENRICISGPMQEKTIS